MSRLTPDQNIQLYIVSAIIVLAFLVWLFFRFIYRPTEEETERGSDPTPASPQPEKGAGSFEKKRVEELKRVEEPKKTEEISSGRPQLYNGQFYSPLGVDPPIPMRVWVPDLVNDETTIHILEVGPTKIGKTTLAKLLVQSRVESGHRIVVLDPDSALDTWGDLVVFGGGDDFKTIDLVLQKLLDEFQERGKKRSQSQERDARFQPITVVIDEIPALQAQCPFWPTFFEEIGSRGRKRQIHLILLTQSSTVASLGIDGKGQLRENFTKVNLQTREIFPPDQPTFRIDFNIPDLLKFIRIDFLDKRWAFWTREELEDLVSTSPPPHHLVVSAPKNTKSAPDGMGVVETRDWKKEDLVRWLAEETDLSQSKILEWFRGDQTALARWVKETREV